MQIFYSIKDLKKNKNTVLTLGTFDGIHPGHLKIIGRLVSCSKEKGCRNVVITFYPHPRTILGNDNSVKMLTTQEEKIELLEKLGVENLLIINFTKEFASLSAEDFIYDYLINGIGLTEIVLGHDHHFGKGRRGNAELLQKIADKEGFIVTKAEAFMIDGEAVSSTKIRNAIAEGDIIRANKLLGRNYEFSGIVVGGDKRGRELGFPTANIKLSSQEKLLPASGVYAVKVMVENERHTGLLSIGKRPTFYNQGELVSEVYIYDFNREIYGAKVTTELVERLRGEVKFNSAEELINQMNTDKENGYKIFNKLNN
ncbi:MAG: bifunctional riboflavin kinase/FAD synthetase [Ignavibacteriota bacterium]|nr:bifunctional riboflavin kinase/FAD synthetase [Ignavibacteriota bacterium]MCO6446774.1 bifunctional riboflavin kinase/FAD synthetase [Ignavibacterium album]QKK00828.1 MAG: bifunctional riboflavin kinase/FAD synthetase [Ignavibacteriota bacterium]HOJ07665.1 bifunctional riboflavin kinase/FAD synthetase [Ignavibacteriaceae bacterium]